MNIFFLHLNPIICARYHVDRHVVKMIVETCQLLCTAIWLSGGEAPYKQTHMNHPSAIWARNSKKNWLWLRELGLALCDEYTYRYEKTHKCQSILESLVCPDLSDDGFTEPSQAMPDEYKDKSGIIAYRTYYIEGKDHLHLWKKRHAWKKREVPTFILDVFPEYELYPNIN